MIYYENIKYNFFVMKRTYITFLQQWETRKKI